jgi:hypothetical protein
MTNRQLSHHVRTAESIMKEMVEAEGVELGTETRARSIESA